MSKETMRAAYAGAILGSVIGLAMVVVTLGGYLLNMAYSGAAFFLIFTALGFYILFWGLLGLVGARQLKNRPALGAGLLIVSAVGGCLLGYAMIAWGIPALLELVAAFRVLRELQKRKASSH